MFRTSHERRGAPLWLTPGSPRAGADEGRQTESGDLDEAQLAVEALHAPLRDQDLMVVSLEWVAFRDRTDQLAADAAALAVGGHENVRDVDGECIVGQASRESDDPVVPEGHHRER